MRFRRVLAAVVMSACGLPIVGAWPPDGGAMQLDGGECPDGGCGRDVRCDSQQTTVRETPQLSYPALCRAVLPACDATTALLTALHDGGIAMCARWNGSWEFRTRRSSADAGGLGCETRCDYYCGGGLEFFCDGAGGWSPSAPSGCALMSGWPCP